MVGTLLWVKSSINAYDRVREVMGKMLLISLCMAAVVSVLFLTIPQTLYSVFTPDPDVIAYGVVYLRIMALGCIVMAYAGAFKSISTGAGAALLSLILGVLDAVCRVAVCLIASTFFDPTASAYFWGAALCQLVPGIISMMYFFSGKWKTKELLTER